MQRMKGLFRKLREGNDMLNIAAVTAAVMFLLATPCWKLYVWALDLGPGGLGGMAQADTPLARSVADLESLDRFALLVYGTGDEYYKEEYFFVSGDTYWVFPLDSGEQVAGRCTQSLENIQREKKDGVYQELYPVGAWREWKLTGEERAGVERDAPQLTTTAYYVDMEGSHSETMTEARFKEGFWLLCLVVGLGAMFVEHRRQEKRRQKEIDITLPQNDLERWIVGTYAIWGQFFAQLGRTSDGRRDVAARRGPIRIGGQPMDDKGQKYTRDTLKDSWDISNGKELLETVDYMSIGPGFASCDTQAARAWQLCRSMQLLGMSFAAGWISRKDMVERSCQVGRLMQEHFRSWEELCESFLEGFFIWRRRAFGPEDARDALQERMDIYGELKSRPDSPYKLSWYLPLDPEAQRRRDAQFGALEK